ncbi:Rv1355c family protein [Antrihabitans sp. YC2-6]|uniref:Rv1355c family protein n=1 Tax=Antrihabitans sp. YC2-6 TaxID=2799498 RepID=UPI0027DC96A3|nr:Rv1355c family protein [Antrihabitans sp. YC2-6]
MTNRHIQELPADQYAPRVLDIADPADAAYLERLRRDDSVLVVDKSNLLTEEMAELVPPLPAEIRDEPARWVYYPWRRAVLHLPGPRAFRRLRLDRNRNKITSEAQARFEALTIGVVGLSVGHAIAHTIALEGLCGELRLADFDEISLSNLNRIPASVLDIGENKAYVAARRIAEVDPYLRVDAVPSGISDSSIAAFLDGLDLVVEECDSMDIKIAVREAARGRGIPVLMETSDRGLLDVERYDLDPNWPLMHGLVGAIDRGSLAAMSPADRAEFVIDFLERDSMSPQLLASMSEIGTSLSTWPQLGSDVQLGGAIVAAAIRRFGQGLSLPSGRIRVCLDDALDGLCQPESPARTQCSR